MLRAAARSSKVRAPFQEAVIDWISNTFDLLQQLLYENVIQPIVFGLGFGNLLEDAFDATGWLLWGLIQVAVLLLGIRLLEKRWPVEFYAQLLEKALRDVKPGDILLAHLGIWERQDPWAPAVLEPLMTGLEQRGLCFAPLREHPRFASLFSKP